MERSEDKKSAEDLAGHIVHLGGGMVAVCLRDFAQGFALGEEAALDAGPFGRALYFYVAVNAFTQRLFPEVPVGDIRDIALVDITV